MGFDPPTIADIANGAAADAHSKIRKLEARVQVLEAAVSKLTERLNKLERRR